jgi:hypothetical protein
MSETELRQKFMGCLEAGGIGADAGRRAADLILDLESQPDLRAITRLLSAAAVGRSGAILSVDDRSGLGRFALTIDAEESPW